MVLGGKPWIGTGLKKNPPNQPTNQKTNKTQNKKTPTTKKNKG